MAVPRRACYGALGSGCGAGVCAPTPSTPFGAGVCIAKAGDNACPSGYPQKNLFYQKVSDTRGCTDCSCAAPQGATCTGSVELDTNNTCTVDPVTLNNVGVCAALPPDPTPPPPPYQDSRSVIYDAGPALGGSCSSSGGTVVGSATANDPVTFCCP